MEEIWKPIKGYEGLYEVSNLGNFKSTTRLSFTGNRRINSKILKGNNVYLLKDGVRRCFRKNKIVYTHFVGDIPKDRKRITIRHKDGNNNNFSCDNLYVVVPLSYEKKPKIKNVVPKSYVKKTKIKNVVPFSYENSTIIKDINTIIMNETYKKTYTKGKYIENDKLLYHIIISKNRGKRTKKLEEMLYQVLHGVFYKLNLSYPLEYRFDIFNDAYIRLLTNYNRFDEKKYDNAIAYISELAKRALADGFNKERFKTKNYQYLNQNYKFLSLNQLNIL